MTDQPPDWATAVPSTPGVHPSATQQTDPVRPFTDQQLQEIGSNMLEQFLKRVVLAVVGTFVPGGGSAFEQLQQWAGSLPLVGPLINMLIGFLSGGSQSSGGLGDLTGLLKNIPLIGQLIAMFTGGSSGGSGGTPPPGTPQGASGLAKVIQDLMKTLFGGNPPPLGTGGGTDGQTPTPTDPGDSTSGVITGNNDLEPYLKDMFHQLVGAGAGGSNTKVPAHTLNALSSGTGKSVLPDGDFVSAKNISGQGQWIWDWPGKGGGTWGGQGCIRTLRPGTITIYCVIGTHAILPNMSTLPDPRTGFINNATDFIYTEDMWKAKAWPPSHGGYMCDFSKFEFVLVPYPGAMFPMGGSVAEGARQLVSLIQATPGKFMLMGWSQGGGVVSNVYDEIRYGVLQARNDDFLFGVGIGNTRRQKGRSFPGGPVYCPEGWGSYEPTLSNTEDRWWEWSIPAGTYPAFDKTDGATWALGDVVSCVGNTADLDKSVRKVIGDTMKAQSLDILKALGVVYEYLGTPGGQALQKALAPAEAHAASVFIVQPFLAQGNHRTMWKIIWDHINSLAYQANPPADGVMHKLWADTPVVVKPGQALKGKCEVCWENMPNNVGAEIILGVDVWNSDGVLIPGDVEGQPTVIAPGTAAVITNPTPGADWLEMSATFVMPEDGDPATACLALYVAPEAMKTATVWADKFEFEQTKLIDAALFDNLEGLEDKFLPESVAGSQGIEDIASTLQTMIDGFVSANKNTKLTEQQLSEVFASQAQTAVNAAQALALVEALNEQMNPGTVVVSVSKSWNIPGTDTFNLPSWVTTGDEVLGVALGGGGSGAVGGRGGDPGDWGWEDPLVYGIDIPAGTTQLKIVVGQGGALNGNGPGDNGAPSSIRLMNDTVLVSAAGGLGGGAVGGNNLGKTGLGPGDFEYPPTGEVFFGGSDVAAGKPGLSPGGAAGGSANAFTAAPKAGNGAVWVTVRRP